MGSAPAPAGPIAAAGTSPAQRTILETAQRPGTLRRRRAARVRHAIDACFAVAYVALSLRLLLALIGTPPDIPVAHWLLAPSAPLLLPVRPLLPHLTGPDGYPLVLPMVVVIGCYALLHLAARGLLARSEAAQRTPGSAG